MDNHDGDAERGLRQQLTKLIPGQAMEAVYFLRQTKKPQSPDQVDRMTRELVARVEREVGMTAQDIVVFPNLRSFVVRAEAPLLSELLEQSEIASAVANR